MFTHLGIDWGSKRVGIAFGDLQTGLVIPATYSCLTEDVFVILKKEITTKKITTLVVGKPSNFQLSPTSITHKINDFLEELKLQFPELAIVEINENGSSKTAKTTGTKDKTMINHLAAADILERYFYSVSQK